jgi:hypothetical protein
VSAASSDETTAPREEVVGEGANAVSPELLRLIQRVAHREYLLDGAAHAHVAAPRPRTAPRSPARRRPAIGTARGSSARGTRGTTARKVTWS